MSLSAVSKAIVQQWDRFFFAKTSPLPMAVYRILFGLIMLATLLLQILPDLDFWYGTEGPFNPTITNYFIYKQPLFDLMIWCGSPLMLHLFFAAVVVSAFMVTIGLFTRTASLFLFLAYVSMSVHNTFNGAGGDCILKLGAFYLSFSRAGDMLSVDRWWKERAGLQVVAVSWPWAQRLLQLQLAFVYCDTVLMKLTRPPWLDGTAVYLATRLEDYFRFPVFGLFDSLAFCQAATWISLGIETSLWTLIWFKPLRYWVLLAGLIFHAILDYTLNLPLFEWAFVIIYVTFIEPDDLQRFFDKVAALFKGTGGRPLNQQAVPLDENR